ncbi:MAG TPA: glycosyltransferase family 39 protein [Oscillospiraceae bacterium]|nr:glycosyltransferase family 39 protein [Oscillospiraceae bacterium]
MLQIIKTKKPQKFSPELLKKNWHIFALILIGCLSFFFNFYAISQYGTGNEYYAAAIKSMTQNFHNFFFVSFDPAGMVSVDKPPLGLWMQVISVLIFGYHGWSMLLPQALAGTGSCIMLYILTAKHFGRPAGLISSLLFALTPIVVVASRNNTIDMQLIFVLLIAAWFLFKSIDSGKWRYLFITAVFIGLGFNIKMLQAYLILPAVALTYLFFAKEKVAKRFLVGVISMVIMLAVSSVWVIAVDLYPSSNRPYVDSSTNNTVVELIFGHNGMERISGQQGMGGGMGGGAGGGNMPQMREDGGDGRRQWAARNDGNSNASQSGTTQNDGGTPPRMHDDGNNSGKSFVTNRDGGIGGGLGGSEIGAASILRLWSSNLYGQISWILLFALCSALVGIVGNVRKFHIHKPTAKQGVFAFWTLWLISMGLFFSFAGFFHRYYLCMLAPAIAVLSAIGITSMVRGFLAKKTSWKQYICPVILFVSLLATIALEVLTVIGYTSVKAWLLPIITVSGGLGILLFILHFFKAKKATLIASTICLLVSVLAAPIYWSLTPVLYVPNSTMPFAGPELASQGSAAGNGIPNNPNITSQNSKTSSGTEKTQTSGLEAYLVKNYKSGSFLLTTQRANTVAQYIIDTGLPCYAYGGFLGSDQSLTLDKLKTLVAEGKITYFLASSEGGGGENSNSEILTYVKANATLIDASAYNDSSNSTGDKGMGFGNGSLYLFKTK